jgi:hypothetical protein
MSRQGYDLELVRFEGRQWRATFYPAGLARSFTSLVGTAHAETPWRAVQGAAWEALRKVRRETAA